MIVKVKRQITHNFKNHLSKNKNTRGFGYPTDPKKAHRTWTRASVSSILRASSSLKQTLPLKLKKKKKKKIGHPKNYCNYPKIRTMWLCRRVMRPKDADGMAVWLNVIITHTKFISRPFIYLFSRLIPILSPSFSVLCRDDTCKSAVDINACGSCQ